MISMTLTEMVRQLTSAVGSSNSSDTDKSRTLIAFVEEVAEQVLLRAGFVKPKMVVVNNVHQMDRPLDPWLGNRIASTAELPEDGPDDMLEGVPSLWLENVPTALDAHCVMESKVHEFVFCTNRVIEWDSEHARVRRVMTYEEVARFVILWLAEKILQIIRKNEWDRIKELPDLYDRLATFWTPVDVRQSYIILVHLDENDRNGYYTDYAGAVYAHNITEAASKTGMKVVEVIHHGDDPEPVCLRLEDEKEGKIHDLVLLSEFQPK